MLNYQKHAKLPKARNPTYHLDSNTMSLHKSVTQAT